MEDKEHPDRSMIERFVKAPCPPNPHGDEEPSEDGLQFQKKLEANVELNEGELRLSQLERDLADAFDKFYDGGKKKKTASVPTDDFVQSIMNCFDARINGLSEYFSETLEKELREELRKTVDGMKQDIEEKCNSDGGAKPMECRKDALTILGVFDRFFAQLLIKRARIGMSSAAVTGQNSFLKSDSRNTIRKLSSLRTVLYFISIATSTGTARWAVTHFTNFGPDLVFLMDWILGPSIAVGVSQVILNSKRQIQQIGNEAAVHADAKGHFSPGYSLPKAMRVFWDQNRVLAVTALAFILPDVGSNIWGGFNLLFGYLDAKNQMTDVGHQLDSSEAAIQGKIDEAKKEDYKSKASLSAAGALADEATGLYSGVSGFGPRFFALEEVYFPGQDVDFYTGQNDSRCSGAVQVTDASNPRKDVQLGILSDASLCITLSKSVRDNDSGSQIWGWIIGPSVKGVHTAEDILLAHVSDASYKTALAEARKFLAEHPNGYAESVDAPWSLYLDTVQASSQQHFATAHGIVEKWHPTDNVKEEQAAWDKAIKPELNKILEDEENAKKKVAEAEMGVASAYSGFDASLLTKLSAEKDKSIAIPPLPFTFLQLGVPEPDLTNNLALKGLQAEVLSVIERQNTPLLAFLAVLLFVTVGVVSYADLPVYYRKICLAYQKDQMKVAAKSTELKRYVTQIMLALNTHLNGTPFADYYGGGAGKPSVPESFIERRLTDILTDLSEHHRSVAQEEGLVASLQANYSAKKADLPAQSVWDQVSDAGRAVVDADTAPIRAYNRLVAAVTLFTGTPDAFHSLIMCINGQTPEDVLNELLSAEMASTPGELGAEFRREMKRRIQGMMSDESAESPLLRLTRLTGLAEKLQSTMNIMSEEWLFEYALFQDETVEVGVDLFPGVTALAEGLDQARASLTKAFTLAVAEFDEQIREVAIHADKELDSQKCDVESSALEPGFAEVECALNAMKFETEPWSKTSKTVNHFQLIVALQKALASIPGLRKKLETLTPQAAPLRKRKIDLKTRCDNEENTLQSTLSSLEDKNRVRPIFERRQGVLSRWTTKNVPENPEKDFDEQQAAAFLNAFAALYGHFYSENAEYQPILCDEHGVGEESISLERLIKAFGILAKDLEDPKDVNTFNLDDGARRSYNFAWKIGTSLQSSFKALGVTVYGLKVPNKLPKGSIGTNLNS